MGNASEWLLTLLGTDRGKLFLQNLACDVSTTRVTSTQITDFITSLIDTLSADISTLEVALGDPNLRHLDSPFFRTDLAIQSARLLLSGPVCGAHSDLVTVKKFDRSFCLVYFDARTYHGLPRSMDHQELFTFLECEDETTFLSIRCDTASLKGYRPLVWLTTADDIHDLISHCHPDNVASRVRDFLGLNHWHSDEFLIQVIIPRANLHGLKIRRPLAFDAGPNLIFRTKSNHDEHGRAVDLSDCNDGGREFISTEIPFRLVNALKAIGKLTRSTTVEWARLYESPFNADTVSFIASLQHLIEVTEHDH